MFSLCVVRAVEYSCYESYNYWVTKDPDKVTRIRDRFGIGTYRSVNGETPAEIREEDLELLRETERRGFIQIRNKPE